MKTISTALAQPLAGEATTLATCWKILRRDQIVLGFTDHVRDLEVDGVTYKAASHHNAHGNSAAPEPNPTSTRLPALPSSTETKQPRSTMSLTCGGGWPAAGTAGSPMPCRSATKSFAMSNLEQALAGIAPQLTAVGRWLFGFVGTASLGIVQFVIAIFIAAALLVNAAGGERVAHERPASRAPGTALCGSGRADDPQRRTRHHRRGAHPVDSGRAWFPGRGPASRRPSGAGLPAARDHPAATCARADSRRDLWLYPLDATAAVIFGVWCGVISLIDIVLKPLLLGRGVDPPVLVGAIGGLLSSGILGLFVSPVVLALADTLVTTWLRNASPAAAAACA